MSFKRALVTGGAGFIGSHIVDRLISDGYEVFIIDNMRTGRRTNISHNFGNPKCYFDRRDIQSPSMYDIFRIFKPEVVFHLAAIPGVPFSVKNPTESNETNIQGTVNLLNLSVEHDVKRFIFSSSSSVYGGSAVLPTPENTPLNPKSPYALQKKVGEEYCKMFSKLYDLDTVSLRYFNCYDDQTEILTESGFKLFKDLKVNDKILTLNPETKEIEPHKAEAWQIHDFDGKLINFKSKSYDLCVTKEHSMYVGRDNKFKLQTAQSLLTEKSAYSKRLMRTGASWIGKEELIYKMPKYEDRLNRLVSSEKYIDMGDWCEFLGWYISEGSAFVCGKNKNHRIVISQSKKVNPEKYKRIVKLVERMGFSAYLPKNGKDVIINSIQLYQQIIKYFPDSGCHNKHIPKDIRGLSTRLLSRLFESMMLGDGSKNGRKYATVSKTLSDHFTEICLKLGKSITVGMDNGCYKLSITEDSHPQLGCNRKKEINYELVPYRGKVYDVTVPNHIIYVRRNGKSCWSGNCFGPRQYGDSPYSSVISSFAESVREKKSPIIYGDGEQYRDFCYVDNVVSANILSANHDKQLRGEVFNIGCGTTTTVNDLVKLIKTKKPIYETERGGDVKCSQADVREAADVLGYKVLVPFEDGLEKTMKWYLG